MGQFALDFASCLARREAGPYECRRARLTLHGWVRGDRREGKTGPPLQTSDKHEGNTGPAKKKRARILLRALHLNCHYCA